jgi:hypothetical protein
MRQLPGDTRLDIKALSNLLIDTQNSYKHLLFGFLLSEISKRAVDQLSFTAKELHDGMLKVAEFPAIKCRLSLGTRDQAVAFIQGTKVSTPDESELLKWVPYRLLRPFFTEHLKNKADPTINDAIYQLSNRGFISDAPPMYRLNENDGKLVSLEVHPSWQEYLIEHWKVIDGWRQWHWANFLQRRNPSALNVLQKLESTKRSTHELSKVRGIWREMLMEEPESIRCTYSGVFIAPSDIVVDHYLPWSYFGHDQAWNLCPTVQRLNSQKSDCLPDEGYLKSLAHIQHKTLSWVKTKKSPHKWRIFSEDYLSSLHLPEDGLLDRAELEQALGQALLPHYALAKKMGFSGEWRLGGD